MSLQAPTGEIEEYEILNVFPFTSQTKRMGIVVRSKTTQQITFYIKGADSVMSRMVRSSDWLVEECDNLAREGLRTLVFAYKNLSQAEYDDFAEHFHDAKAVMQVLFIVFACLALVALDMFPLLLNLQRASVHTNIFCVCVCLCVVFTESRSACLGGAGSLFGE